MLINRIFFLVAASLVLNGCIFRDRSEDYQRAGSIESIAVPEQLNAAPMEALYPIPSVQRADDAFYDITTDGFVIPRPEPMSAEREAAKVKIQKVGSRRWVLAEAPTSQVWPLAQSYLSSIGIDVASSNPASGLIETDWVTFKAQPDLRSRFRVRIEKGVGPDSTEIHVLQRQAATGANPATEWPQTSDSSEREAWLLDGLANSVAGNINNNAASLLGQSVGGNVKAELFMDGEEPSLRLLLDRDRAWATLAHALTKEGFKVWEENSAEDLFYVQYQDEQKPRGWLRRLLTPEPKSATQNAPYSLAKVLAHLASTEKVRKHFAEVQGASFAAPLDDIAGYLVLMQPQDNSYVVTIRAATGARLDLALNKKLLSVMRRNLI